MRGIDKQDLQRALVLMLHGTLEGACRQLDLRC